MPNADDQLANLRIAAPCQTSWEGMAGDERVRHCTLCSLNVYNFAEMTRDEVRELLGRTEGRVCARVARRADGTVLTRRRASRVAAALIAVLFSLPAFAFDGWPRGSKVKLKIERIATRQPAVFDGVVRDQSGNPLPGVIVTVQDETTARAIAAVTDVNGAFSIASLHDGIYRFEVTVDGFQPATVEHLQLKASQSTHASVAMRVDATPRFVMGGIAPNPN